MPRPLIPFEFKGQFITGQSASRRWRGRVAPDALHLGDASIPYGAIRDTLGRPPRVAVQVDPECDLSALGDAVRDGGVIVVLPSGVDARTLEREIDRRCSLVEAETRRALLEAAGRAGDIRLEMCPVCDSQVDVTPFPDTTYVYCRYCESLFRTDRGIVTDGGVFQGCTNCGMYDRVQSYTEFYFYFLVLIVGTRMQQRFLCDACARKIFFKTFAANLPFVIGIPGSLAILFKLLRARDASFEGLPTANSLARKGRYAEADRVFSEILERVPEHPGILTNMASGHINGGDLAGAKVHLARALRACSHYPPALRLLG